jgi:hypothetical protein
MIIDVMIIDDRRIIPPGVIIYAAGDHLWAA